MQESIYNKIIEDIKEYGWHVVAIMGDGTSPSFCFTIGLMETYQHPEILVFSPNDDPRSIASLLTPIVAKIADGNSYQDGHRLRESFLKYPMTFRKVLPLYFGNYMGAAKGYYQKPYVDSLQLIWPDGNNNPPWHSDYSKTLLQPTLYQDNLFLAGLTEEDSSWLLEQEGKELWADSLSKVLIDASQLPGEDYLETWAPQLGKGGTLHSITIFGDPLVRNPKGSIDWLDISQGEVHRLAANESGLIVGLMKHATKMFHRHVYLHASELDWGPEPGEVFSWRQNPFNGGALHLDNLDLTFPLVHLRHSGKRFNQTVKQPFLKRLKRHFRRS